MVLANGNVFSLYASPSDAKEEEFVLQQIVDNPFSKSDFTKVSWAKSVNGGVSENGELYLVIFQPFSSTLPNPLSLCQGAWGHSE